MPVCVCVGGGIPPTHTLRTSDGDWAGTLLVTSRSRARLRVAGVHRYAQVRRLSVSGPESGALPPCGSPVSVPRISAGNIRSGIGRFPCMHRHALLSQVCIYHQDTREYARRTCWAGGHTRRKDGPGSGQSCASGDSDRVMCGDGVLLCRWGPCGPAGGVG